MSQRCHLYLGIIVNAELCPTAYESLRTIGDLLLTNADFRLFLDDLTTIGRQIFADTAHSLSDAANQVANAAEPSQGELGKVKEAGADDENQPTTGDLNREVTDIAETAGEAVAQTGQKAVEGAKENLSGGQKDALLHRLKQAVLKLRTRTDYSDSVSTLSRLIRFYGKLYAHAAENVASVADEDIEVNREFKNALDRFWGLARSFGDSTEWNLLEQSFRNLLKHANDPESETLFSDIGASLQEMLMNPEFFNSASERFDELKEKTKTVGSGTALRDDADAFLQHARSAIKSIATDPAVANLVASVKKFHKDLSNAYQNESSTIVADAAHIFLPLLVRSIQRIPIPRLEISVPEMDLLIENLVLEPGKTVHSSSFFPYKARVTSRTDMEMTKVHSKMARTTMKTIITVSLSGLNVCASEFGFWIRAHSGPLFRFGDEGIANFFLDERGIDVSVDLEVGPHRLASLLTLRGVRVHIHKLDYKVHRSRWKYLLWIVKPFLKQLVRRVLERKIAEQIVSAVISVNRELVFARERLRAVNIANPRDLSTFIRAVLSRPRDVSDPNIYRRLGTHPPKSGVFQGVYAPGSIVKVWQQEAEHSQEVLESGDETGGLHRTWRNQVFDVNATTS